jgi:hypothetical protein
MGRWEGRRVAEFEIWWLPCTSDAGKGCILFMLIVEELELEVVPEFRDNCHPRSL